MVDGCRAFVCRWGHCWLRRPCCRLIVRPDGRRCRGSADRDQGSQDGCRCRLFREYWHALRRFVRGGRHVVVALLCPFLQLPLLATGKAALFCDVSYPLASLTDDLSARCLGRKVLTVHPHGFVVDYFFGWRIRSDGGLHSYLNITKSERREDWAGCHRIRPIPGVMVWRWCVD